MLALLWTVSVRIRYYLRRYAPSNIVLDKIRTRRGLKFGVPAMLLAVPYLVIASSCTAALAHGAPGYLNLIVLWGIWNSFKLILMGPWSLVLLARVRIIEATERRRIRRAANGVRGISRQKASIGYQVVAVPEGHGA